MALSESRLDRLAALMLPIAWGAHLVMIWAFRFLPSTDYPEWLLQAQVLAHYDDPAFGFDHWYMRVLAPVPNGGFVLPAALLARFLPVEIAGKLVLSLYVLWFPVAVRSYVRAVRNNSSFWTVSIVLLFNMSFVNGNIAFLIGVCVLLHLLGQHEVGNHTLSALGIVRNVLLSAALFLSHAVCAFAYLAYVITRLLSEQKSRFDAITASINVPLMIGLGSWYYFARPVHIMSIGFDWGLDWRYRLSVLPKSFIGGIAFPPYDFSVWTTLANAMVFILAACVIFLALGTLARRLSTSPHAVFVLILLCGTLFAPRLLLGIGESSQRFALILFLVLLGFLDVGPRITRLVQTCILILAVLVTAARWQGISEANTLLRTRHEFLRRFLPGEKPIATMDDDLGKDVIPFHHLVPKGITFIFQTDYHLLSGGFNPWSFRTGYVIPRPEFSAFVDSLSSRPARGGALSLKGREIPSWIQYIVLDAGPEWKKKTIGELQPDFMVEAETEIAEGIQTVVLHRAGEPQTSAGPP